MGGAVEHGTKAMLLPAATEATEATDAARQVYEATGGDAAAAIKAAEARYATTSAMGVLPLAAPGGILPAVTGWLGPVIRAADRLGSGAASGASVGEVARQVNNLALPNQMQAPFSAEELALGAVTGSALAIGGPRGANAARVQVQRIEAAARGQQAAKLLAQLNRLAEASKVRERDPAQAQAFFQSILAEGRDSVWITPKALAESGIVDQVAALPGVAEQLATAAETGHDIRLPVADLMAHLAGPELEQGILPHVSTEPGGFTARTAEEYYQTGAAAELQAEVARVLGDDAAVAPARASTEKVKAAVLADLEAAGRFTGGAHEVYATLVSQFYAVQAARLGMTPEGLYHDYPLRVTARGGPGEAFGQPIISDAIAAAKAVIRNALAASKADPRHTNRYDLFPVAPEAVAEAAQFGLDINGYTHAIDGSAIRHSIKSHGNAKKEAARGQIAITDADFEAIPDILSAPDTAVYGLKNDIGRDMIVYLKTMPDGTTVYLEEVRTGRKVLTTQSMRRFPRTTSAASIVETLRPTSETASGGAFSVVEHPAARNISDRGQGGGETLNQDPAAPRGSFSPDTLTITLHQGADLSTFLHETGHAFLELQTQLATRIGREAEGLGGALSAGERELIADTHALLKWFGVRDLDTWHAMPFEERRGHHERFARGFEVYLHEGKAPSLELAGAFQRYRAYLVAVYRDLLDKHRNAAGARQGLGVGLEVKLTDEVRGVMDRMIASTEQIQAAEHGRSMMPLFERAIQGGMTPEEFRDYQALGIDATNTAIEDLQARGVRDLQWIERARGRMVGQFQREARGLRAQAQMDARRELESQPVYQAWQFLTRRLSREDMSPEAAARDAYLADKRVLNKALKTWEGETLGAAQQAAWESPVEGQVRYRRRATLERAQRKVAKREAAAIAADMDARRADWEAAHPAPVEPEQVPRADAKVLDPERDSLFVAIAKLGGLNKDDVLATFGMDPADSPKSGVFGKPVWRREGGRSIDGMVEALAREGYLPVDEHGKSTVADLERLFDAELRGKPQHSNRFNPDLLDSSGSDQVANPRALGAGRINRAALADVLERNPDAARITAALDAARMLTSKGGLHPDIVADIVPGLHSGEELARALADVTPLQEALAARTDALMLERHGEIATPEALAAAADRAIFNDVRARLVTVEANALAKATGTPQILTRAAQEFAGQMVARLRVRDLRPDLYAAGAARAGKAAAKASQGGDLATAAAEKRNQVIMVQATKAAYEARAEISAAVKYLKRFDRPGPRKALDVDYRDQIDALLERYGLRQSVSGKALDKRQALNAFVESLASQGLEPNIPETLLADASLVHYKDMPIEDFRGLVDAVKSIEHLGRLNNTLRDGQRTRAINDLAAEAVHAMGQLPQRTPESNRGLSRMEEAWVKSKSVGRSATASLLKIEQMFDWLDARNSQGVMNRIVFRRIADAGTHEQDLLKRVKADIDTLIETHLADITKDGGRIYVADKLIDGMTITKSSPGRPMRLTKKGMLMLAGNMGNGSNVEKLCKGEGWQEKHVWDFLHANMTKGDWDYVAGMGKVLESLWPLKIEMSRRLGNTNPPKIQPRPFDTPHGKYPGWYWPMLYDPARDQHVAERSARKGDALFDQNIYSKPGTDTGRGKALIINPAKT